MPTKKISLKFALLLISCLYPQKQLKGHLRLQKVFNFSVTGRGAKPFETKGRISG
jgi:hypothetical protein